MERSVALAAYAEIVRRWAPKLDLVSPADLDRFESRHIEDSLRAVDAVDAAPPGPAADVGSGAGLPGIPLAIVTGRHWRLVEPRKRRAAFLEEAVRELGLDCEVLAMTAEQAVAAGYGRAHAVVTARALADPAASFRLCEPLTAPGGSVLVFHGERFRPGPESEEVAPGIARVIVTGS